MRILGSWRSVTGQIGGSRTRLEQVFSSTDGFQRFVTWARALRDQHGLRILAIAGETTGIYYWA